MISEAKTYDRINTVFDKGGIDVVHNKKKSNRNNISVKDGIITYKVLIKEFKCQCGSLEDICDHILLVPYSYFMLDAFVISFILIKGIKDRFLEYLELGLELGDFNATLERDIMNTFKNTECGICLSSLSDKKYKYEVYECPECRNPIHHKCMAMWRSKKNPDGSTNGCIYCNTKN